MRKLNIILLTCLLACATGCATFPFPGVYVQPMQQGNIVAPDLIAELHYGMTADEVVNIMGQPVLTNVFSPQRFDYVYTFQLHHNPMTEKRVTLFFSNGRLYSMSRARI